MTRHERLVEDMASGNEALAAIKGLNFFPDDWHLSVQLSERKPKFSYRNPRRKQQSKKPAAPTPSLRLQLPRSWLETVYKKGLARVAEFFILKATPVMIPEGADGAWEVQAMTRAPHHWPSRALVQYGGVFSINSTTRLAMDGIIQHFEKQLLIGDKPHEALGDSKETAPGD